jgi:hypothetical protein
MMLRKLFFMAVVAVGGVLPFAVTAYGSQRADALSFGSAATITGSGTLDGTDGDDVIVGSDGNDDLHGKGGNDKICGGAGDDKIGGGPGNDQIDGGPGNDDLDGGGGTDSLLGGEGDDHIECGTDNDVADGGPGTNTAATSGFEACETVTNANATETAAKPNPVAATLTAGQEVPRPKGVRGATGRFTATVTSTGVGATIVWRLTFSRLTGRAIAAHIHLGVPGRAGGVLVALCAPCRSGAQGTLNVDGQPARKAILSGETYVNVHTTKNPAGEVRGQIRRLD